MLCSSCGLWSSREHSHMTTSRLCLSLSAGLAFHPAHLRLHHDALRGIVARILYCKVSEPMALCVPRRNDVLGALCQAKPEWIQKVPGLNSYQDLLIDKALKHGYVLGDL